MKNSTLMGMTALVLFSIGTLILINFTPNGKAVSPKSDFPVDVRGMAIFHDKIPFTLNFEQQQKALDAFTRAVEVKKEAYAEVKKSFPFEKIAIYRFRGEDIELFPIALEEENLVFAVPSLNPDVYYMELSGGELKAMLNNAFDR